LGVAIAAGIGAGVYRDYEDAFAVAVKIKTPIQPNPALAETYTTRYKEWWQLNEAMESYWNRK
jgi:L-xylulokinase